MGPPRMENPVSRGSMVGVLADFASSTTYEALPEEVRSSVRQRVLDIVGISVAALELDTSVAVIEYALSQGGNAQAHAIGTETKLPAAQAAFVNGVLAHSLDYDDTHLPSILHPSAPVIPAALAAAELSGATGSEVIRAVAVGLEICVRLGMAGYDRESNDSLFFERGQHATSICGTVAGAATAALLLDEGTIPHAMGIAASMASGLLEANRSGGTVKRLHCGWAAHSAVTAAELARRGITGPPTVIEGRFGLFQAFIGERFDADALTDGLGYRWEVPGIFFKPYPANHFTHTAIDAAIELRKKVDIAEIEEITLGVATPTIRTVGQPIEVKRSPETGYQAQFSGPYAVAAGLLGGGGLGVGLDDFTDDLAREKSRRALMEKVTIVPNEECDAIYPYQFPAVLTIRTRTGSLLTEKVLTNRGGPDRPLSDEELAIKFTDNALRALAPDSVAEIEDAAKRLDVLESLNELLAPTGNRSANPSEQRGSE
jgi:2-methylcitrate dehydratase PrpD